MLNKMIKELFPDMCDNKEKHYFSNGYCNECIPKWLDYEGICKCDEGYLCKHRIKHISNKLNEK